MGSILEGVAVIVMPFSESEVERFTQRVTRWPSGLCLRRAHRVLYTTLTDATSGPSGFRTRTDRVDRWGKVAVRYAGRLRHLGIGAAYRGSRVLLLINDREVTTSDAATGEILAEHLIDPARDYQPQSPPRPGV